MSESNSFEEGSGFILATKKQFIKNYVRMPSVYDLLADKVINEIRSVCTYSTHVQYMHLIFHKIQDTFILRVALLIFVFYLNAFLNLGRTKPVKTLSEPIVMKSTVSWASISTWNIFHV